MNSLYTNEQLTELYEKTQSSVYAVVYSIVKNEQDALDLTQDTYISAFTNIEKINDNLEISILWPAFDYFCCFHLFC